MSDAALQYELPSQHNYVSNQYRLSRTVRRNEAKGKSSDPYFSTRKCIQKWSRRPDIFGSEWNIIELKLSLPFIARKVLYFDRKSQLLHDLELLKLTPEEDRWPAAIWPKSGAFTDAEKFINSLPLQNMPSPDVYLADDGEINFLWKHVDIFIDAGFLGNGTFSVFARKGKDRFYGDDRLASDGLPDQVIAWFMD